MFDPSLTSTNASVFCFRTVRTHPLIDTISFSSWVFDDAIDDVFTLRGDDVDDDGVDVEGATTADETASSTASIASPDMHKDVEGTRSLAAAAAGGGGGGRTALVQLCLLAPDDATKYDAPPVRWIAVAENADAMTTPPRGWRLAPTPAIDDDDDGDDDEATNAAASRHARDAILLLVDDLLLLPLVCDLVVFDPAIVRLA